MKFMHLADLHIGKNINGYSLLDDQRHALGRIIEQAASLDVDALVLAGDLYDKSTPSAEATALLDWFFTACAAQGLKVLATPETTILRNASATRGTCSREGIHLAGVYRGSIERIDFEDEFGPIAFWLVPSSSPHTFGPTTPTPISRRTTPSRSKQRLRMPRSTPHPQRMRCAPVRHLRIRLTHAQRFGDQRRRPRQRRCTGLRPLRLRRARPYTPTPANRAAHHPIRGFAA